MKWVSWCTVRGLPSPETSILFENWLFAIGRGIIMCCSNTCYPKACRTINYPRRPKRASIVRPRQCMDCHSNRTRLTTAKTFIPTIRCETISPVGVNSISPPAGTVGCVHAQWSVSTVPRAPVCVPPRGPGRAGLPGLGLSSHRHRQCPGHQ